MIRGVTVGLVAAALVILFMASCATLSHAGTASWYGGGEKLNRHTANGEVFRDSTMTAAHWTMRMGTRVRVTNLANGKSVVVRINDRGPHPRLKREIDLTRAAFAKIASLNSGLIRVRVQRL